MKVSLFAAVVFSLLISGCGSNKSESNPSSASPNPSSEEVKKEDGDSKVSAEPEVDETGTKPEVTPAPEKKPEPMPEKKPKPEAKPAPKPEAKPEPKPEAKPAPKPEAKPEPKPEAKPEPKPEVKPAPKPKPEPKPEPKPVPMREPKPSPKTEVKPSPMPNKPAPAPSVEEKPVPKTAPAPEKKPMPAPTPQTDPFHPLPTSIEKSVNRVEQEISQIAQQSPADYKRYVSHVVRNMWAPASLDEAGLIAKFTEGTQEEGALRMMVYTKAVRYFYPEKDYGFGKGFTPELPWDQCFAMAEKFSSRPNGLREFSLFQIAYTYASQRDDLLEPSQPHGLRMIYAYEFANEIAFRLDGAKVLATHRKVFNEHIRYEKGQPNITLNWEEAYALANKAAGIEIPKNK